jgi:hypothetical protein
VALTVLAAPASVFGSTSGLGPGAIYVTVAASLALLALWRWPKTAFTLSL